MASWREGVKDRAAPCDLVTITDALMITREARTHVDDHDVQHKLCVELPNAMWPYILAVF